MTEYSETKALGDGVKAQAGSWRKWEEKWRNLEKEMLALSRHPRFSVQNFYQEIVKEVDRQAGEISERFAVDATQDPPRHLPTFIPPRDEQELAERMVAARKFKAWDAARQVIHDHVLRLPYPLAGERAMQVFVQTQRQLPYEIARELQVAPHEAPRLIGSIQLGGWARTKLTTYEDGQTNRLGRAIQELAGTQDLEDKFVLELPTAALLAIESWDLDYDKLHTRIADQITRGTQGQHKHPTQSLRHTQPDKHDLEDFVLAEEARREIIRRAGLSEQERVVFELEAQGYKEREIAKELGIAKGTVKSVKHRVRKKLMSAA